MPPANTCPRCGRLSPYANRFCAQCGASVPSQTAGKGWKPLLGAVALFGGLLWASAIYTQPGTPAPPAAEPQPRALAEASPTPNVLRVIRATPTPQSPPPTPPLKPDAKQSREKERQDKAEAKEAEADDDKDSSKRASSASSGSSDDYYINSRGERVPRPRRSPGGPPAGATAQCRDGTYSFSRSRRGTCSHHGGVARWL